MSGFLVDASGPYIVSAPGDNRDYSLDWTNLLVVSETIHSVAWTVPAGVILGSTLTAGNITTAWLQTLTIGSYFILATMTTNEGREFNRGFRLDVTENI